LAWKKDVDYFLSELLWLEGRGDYRSSIRCSLCPPDKQDKPSEHLLPEYRCRDCFTGELFCRSCLVSIHSYNPFHYVEVRVLFVIHLRPQSYTRLQHWNGQFFERVTWKDLGLRIQLGHPIGEECPLRSPASGDAFIVIDSHGVHEVGLDFCGCGIHGTMVQQLLRRRLYPATISNPTTAATFRALRHFQLLSFESKCSAHQYFQTLLRESDNTGLRPIKVCSETAFTTE
jgi:hypothetical protein